MASKFVMPIGIELQYSDNLREMLKRSETAINQFAAKVSQTAEQKSTTPGGAASSARHQIRQQLSSERAVVEQRFTDKKSPEYLAAIKGLNEVGAEVVRIVEQSLSNALSGTRLFDDPSQLMRDPSIIKASEKFGGQAQNFVAREELTALDRRLKDIVGTQTSTRGPSGDETIELEGLDAALKRLYGLAVGIEQEFQVLNDGTLSQLTVAARGMLSSMREYSQSLERAEANLHMTRQLQEDPTARQELTQSRLTLGQTRGAIDLDVKRTSENVEAEGELLAGKHLLRLEEQVVKFTQMLQDSESAELKKSFDELVSANKRQVDTLKYVDDAYMDQAVASKLASDVLRRTVNVQSKQLGMDSGETFDLAKQEKLITEQLNEQLAKDRELTDAKDKSRYARDLEELEIKTSIAQRKLNNQEIVESTSVLNQSNRELKRRANDAAWNRLSADGTLTEGSTWFQRMQMNMSRRRGQAPRHATDFSTGPQMLQARAMTTLGFGISGAAMYGGVQLMKDILNESTELQQDRKSVV